MNGFRSLLLVALVGSSVAFAQSSEEEAGDVAEVDKDRTGPLRERVAPVSGYLFLKKKRFELSPSGSITFKDPFYRKYTVGGMLAYHFSNEFGLGLRGGYSVPTVSGAAQICRTGASIVCSDPTMDDLDTAEGGAPPGRINAMADLNLQ